MRTFLFSFFIILIPFLSCGKNQQDFKKQLADEQKLSSQADLNKELNRLRTVLESKTEDTDKAKVYMDISAIYHQKADYHATIKEALTAIKYQPNLPDAHGLLGASYLKLNRFDDAERELSSTLELDEKNSRAYYDMGNLLSIKGKYKEAAAQYTSAIKNNAVFTEAYNNRGGCYSNMNDFKKAEADYLKAFEINPEFAPSCRNLGILYEAKFKNKEKAKQYYQKYIDLFPNASDRMYVAQWLKKLG